MNATVNQYAGKRIFVGLSGGVDSAVTAALLKEAGADVVGVFIKGWYPPQLTCTWADDRRDAMRVAARLQIPFHTLDASTEYKRAVIDYLIKEYKAGRTPNPDIMCNREVKFGAFYQFAKEKGADAIATGHYARSSLSLQNNHSNIRKYVGMTSDIEMKGQLFRGVDEEKDQSYFLWAISKEALAKTLFPLGGYKKSEVRALAKRFNLPVAEKKDSQGICFLGAVSIEDFLRTKFENEEGKALDEAGNEIGMHSGVLLHTLGERVSLYDAAPGPWYVLRKDIKQNILVVSHERTLMHATEGIALTDTNWFGEVPTGEIEVQYRYHGPRILGRFDSAKATFHPSEPLLEPIASGQSLVFYRGNLCLGGGIIF